MKKLIKEGETENIEFKKSTTQLKSALCAFLNNNGGTVIIGSSSEGKITGQNVTDNTKELSQNNFYFLLLIFFRGLII